jgi:small subunit ribosomal protein S16
MAVVLRLTRRGTNKRPYFHVVAADEKFSRDGRFLEDLGTFDPLAQKIDLNVEGVHKWVGQGAQLTIAVKKLLKRAEATAAAAA